MEANYSQRQEQHFKLCFVERVLPVTLLIAFFLVVFSFNVGLAVAAEGDVSEVLVKAREEGLMMFFEPGEIIVTSSARRPQPLKRASSAMTVITAEDIRQSGVTHLADVLRLVPGMQVVHQKGYTFAVSARGLAKVESQRMQILLDGMPVYNPYRGGVSFDFQPIFLDNIERIEVIRGSGGVAWGVNAMNGVINIITKKAADTQGGMVYTGFGNRALQQGHLRLGGTDGTLDWRGSTGVFHDRGFGRDHGKDYDDQFRAFQATGRADLKLDDDTSLTFSGGHKHVSSWIGTTAGNQHDSLQYMNLLWRRQLDDQSTVQIRWSENYYRRLLDTYDLRTREDMIEFQHNFAHDSHSIVWGADYTYDTFDTHMNTYVDLTNPGGTHNNQFSAFIEDEITLADNLWLTIGNRQLHNDLSHHDWAGRAALVWEAAPKHFLRAAVSRSFRRPLFVEEYSHKIISGVNVKAQGNEGLRNERLVSYELGYRGNLRDNLELNIEAFLNEHKDLIGITKTGGTNYYFNVHDFTSYGLETAVDWRPYKWWLVRAFHSYEHQTDENIRNDTTEGKLSIYSVPQHSIGLTNRFYIDKSTTLNTQLYWYDTFFSVQPPATENRIESYFRFDIRLAKKIWNDKAELAFGVTNLGDPMHYEGNKDMEEVPRIVYAQLFYTF